MEGCFKWLIILIIILIILSIVLPLLIGNFLLLSAPHNESIGNKPFALKRSTYNQLKQQREIQIMTEQDSVWNREKIAQRKESIVNFILKQL